MKSEDTELLKEFTSEQVDKLNKIISKHKGKPGGLIPVLEEAQVALEYLPISVQKKIASGLNLPLSRVYGVVTFYSFFHHDSTRQTHCSRLPGNSLLCPRRQGHLRNDEKQFGITEGETTADQNVHSGNSTMSGSLRSGTCCRCG